MDPDPKTAKRFLGSLYPSEQVLWIGQAVDVATGRALVIGFTRKRIVVAGSGWSSQSSAKPKHVVQNRVEGRATVLQVRGMSVPAAEWRIDGLPAEVLEAFLAGALAQSGWGTAPPPRRTAAAAQSSHDSRPEPAVVGSWQQAEEFAAWHMRVLGFRDARVTGAGTDGGIDVVATSAVAQVKHYERASIGGPAVQQLRGAAHGLPWALFYARSGYTAAAVSYAEQAQVALFTYTDDGQVRAASQGGRYLLTSRTEGSDPNVGGFEEFTRAQAQGAEALDAATGEFTAAARVILAKIPKASRRKQATAFERLTREQALVDGIVTRVTSTEMSLRDVLQQCALIRAAAARVRTIRI